MGGVHQLPLTPASLGADRAMTLTAAIRLVAVGSLNPVKIGAARAVVSQLAPAARVEGIGVPSGVSEQPWGDDETIRGALSRAHALYQSAESRDLWHRSAGDIDRQVSAHAPEGSLRTLGRDAV